MTAERASAHSVPTATGPSRDPPSAPTLLVLGLSVAVAGETVVEDVELSIGNGEVLAVVGESGCGKSMTALAVAGLLPPAARLLSGSVRLDATELSALSPAAKRIVRGRDIGMIFQEPVASLNPLMRVGEQIMERLTVHGGMSRSEARAAATSMLAEVGIDRPEMRFRQHPFELSGGMCQRVMIAMNLVSKPKLLIADEPTTALDVTVQAQILGLIDDLRTRNGTSVLFITHDMGVVAQIADRVAVMYGGRVVENGTVPEVFAEPRHPYTKLLLATIPGLSGDRKTRLRTIDGAVPTLGTWPSGCRFRNRCPLAVDRCASLPSLEVKQAPAHAAACWRSGDVEALA